MFSIARELGLPAVDLTLQIVLRPAETVQTQGSVVESTERGDGLYHGEPHAPAYFRGAGMKRRQSVDRVEAFDRFHQVEGRADDILLRTRGNESCMWNVGSGESG